MILMEFFSDSRDKRETFRDDFRLQSRICLFLKAARRLLYICDFAEKVFELVSEAIIVGLITSSSTCDRSIGDHLFVLWGLFLITSRPATSTSGSDRESSVAGKGNCTTILLSALSSSNLFVYLNLFTAFPFPIPCLCWGRVFWQRIILLNLFIAGLSLCQGTCLK